MDIKLSDLDKRNLRSEFFSLLQNFETFPAAQNFFVVQIEKIPDSMLNDDNARGLGHQLGYGKTGSLSQTKDIYKKLLSGYFYIATGVDLTTEKTNVTHKGRLINGYLPVGPFMDTRQYPDTDLEIQFQETNISFVDLLLRPWIQLYASQGNFEDFDLTTNITIHFLSKETVTNKKTFGSVLFGENKGPVVRKTYKYYDCIPFNIKSANVAEYQRDPKIGSIGTQWRFSRYDVISNYV